MEVEDIPVEKRLEVMFKATDMMRDFAGKMVVPILESRTNLSRRETAIKLTYRRMYLLLKSVIKLNWWGHFQGVNAAARTIFELAMDIQFLAHDADGDMVKKFFAFRDVERYRTANLLVKFYEEERGEPVPPEDVHMKELVAKASELARVQGIRKKHWGIYKKGEKKGRPIQPKHWTGKDARGQARELDRLLGTDYERLYVEHYARFSWCVHSGSIGFTEELPAEYYMGTFGMAHHLIREMFTDGTRACVDATRLSIAIPHWERVVAEYQLELLETACRKYEKESGDPVDDDSDGGE